ncbi:hypothetical protein A2U01_0083397, partial [Trifolium medium]|nr:hypothetical protein [Trifolium medium]
ARPASKLSFTSGFADTRPTRHVSHQCSLLLAQRGLASSSRFPSLQPETDWQFTKLFSLSLAQRGPETPFSS